MSKKKGYDAWSIAKDIMKGLSDLLDLKSDGEKKPKHKKVKYSIDDPDFKKTLEKMTTESAESAFGCEYSAIESLGEVKRTSGNWGQVIFMNRTPETKYEKKNRFIWLNCMANDAVQYEFDKVDGDPDFHPVLVFTPTYENLMYEMKRLVSGKYHPEDAFDEDTIVTDGGFTSLQKYSNINSILLLIQDNLSNLMKKVDSSKNDMVLVLKNVCIDCTKYLRYVMSSADVVEQFGKSQLWRKDETTFKQPCLYADVVLYVSAPCKVDNMDYGKAYEFYAQAMSDEGVEEKEILPVFYMKRVLNVLSRLDATHIYYNPFANVVTECYDVECEEEDEATVAFKVLEYLMKANITDKGMIFNVLLHPHDEYLYEGIEEYVHSGLSMVHMPKDMDVNQVNKF